MSEGGTPGTVLFQGLLEGPTAAWNPDPSAVADALRARGLPADLLAVLIEGGRGMLQPREHPYPRGQFSADPAEALGLALQDLFQERPAAADAWCSSLRTVEYGQRERHESLLQLAHDGVRVVRRSAPWTPPPQELLLKRWLRNWPVLLFAGIGVLALAWLKRDYLLERWRYFYDGVFGG